MARRSYRHEHIHHCSSGHLRTYECGQCKEEKQRTYKDDLGGGWPNIACCVLHLVLRRKQVEEFAQKETHVSRWGLLRGCSRKTTKWVDFVMTDSTRRESCHSLKIA